MIFFFFNDTATTEIYTLSLHDALPIYRQRIAEPDGRSPILERAEPGRGSAGAGRFSHRRVYPPHRGSAPRARARALHRDRKSTRLNSSHANISYAVFCLKKKK